MYRLSLAVLLLSACGGPEQKTDTDADADTDADTDSDTDSDTDTDTDSDTDTDTTPIDVPADNLSKALGDCDGRHREPDEYPNQLIPGKELQRYTLGEREAVCNDGSRAVMYVRGWTDPTYKNVWEIHMQGGGGCSRWDDCAIRWCGTDYYDGSKMSSNWAPDEIGAVGVMDSLPGNVLSGANHAFFYYCSSDNWSGQGSMSVVPPDEGIPEGLPADLPAFSMFRRGHTIFEAGIDELEAGVVADLGEALPAMSDATVVMLSGTSAGSAGAKFHADYLTDRLKANGTKVYAVFDAANAPTEDIWPDAYVGRVDAKNKAAYEATLAVSDAPQFMDESCEALYGGTDEAWRCSAATWVMMNHITTPFFVRQDMRDIGGIAEALALPEDDHEQLVIDMFDALGTIQDTAIEGADIKRKPGRYGPNCAQHVAMETTDWWRVATVEAPDGTPTTFQTAVIAWYQGDDVAIMDEPVIGAGHGPGSDCSSVDDER